MLEAWSLSAKKQLKKIKTEHETLFSIEAIGSIQHFKMPNYHRKYCFHCRKRHLSYLRLGLEYTSDYSKVDRSSTRCASAEVMEQHSNKRIERPHGEGTVKVTQRRWEDVKGEE